MSEQMTLPQAIELGIQHAQAGRFVEAESIYRQILAAYPNHADALHQLGLLAVQAGRGDDAIDLIGRAIAASPGVAEYYCNLGNVLQHVGRHQEAIAAMRQAISIQPRFPEALNNLGILLQNAGKLDESIAALEQAVAQSQQRPTTWYNLANALRAAGKTEPAIEAYRRSIALKPEFAMAHYNLALALLLHGDYEQGWREFDYRFEAPDLALKRHRFAQPKWDGTADLTDKRILLLTEQGFGDVIQFARYITLLKERGAKVVVVCQPEMKRLLQSMSDIEQVTVFGEAAPPFDFYSPLLDLARCFGTTPQTIPAPIPYLRADPERAAFWKSRIDLTRGQLKVGLFWHGRATPNPFRSIPLSQLRPLAEVKDVSFISLQKGDGSDQSRTPPPGMELLDWTDEITDFADTAAMIENLDLVISIDSAAAHLAGAMGKPVWTLLSTIPDWRWMMNRSDSPWYPTMKLFRQTQLDQWGPVVDEVAQMLTRFK